MKVNYRNFEIEIIIINNYKAEKAIAYLNGEPIFGSYSELDNLSAFEKICIKIDNFLKFK